jgi:hypothetical protein
MDDGVPYHTFKTNAMGEFEPWLQIGGGIIGLPGVACWGPNRIDISAHGIDGKVYHKSYINRTWQPAQIEWVSLSGVISGLVVQVGVTGSLTEISDRVERLAVYCIGALPTRSVFTKTYGGDGWQPPQERSWISLGGECIDDTVSAVSGKEPWLDLAIRRSDGTVMHKLWNGESWEPSQADWFLLGGELSGPPVLSPAGSLKLEIFGRWVDGTLRYWS